MNDTPQFEPLICQHINCGKELVGQQRKFCSINCAHKFYAGNVLNPEETTVAGDKCKWCIDSDHKEFCCIKHEKQYDRFRYDIDNELSKKPEHKYTKAQDKAWSYIKFILTGQ